MTSYFDNVSIIAVPPKLIAASSFTGNWSGDRNKMNEEYEKLKEKFSKEGYTETGAYEGHFFNPPYAISFLRRNDVCVPVMKEE